MDRTLVNDTATAPQSGLKRSVGPVLLTLYGTGVMVGAGIYVLVGAVADKAGVFAPIGFLVAGIVAAPTAFSYSELSSRVPESAGEAAFVRKAFSKNALSLLVGATVIGVGVTSSAAVLRGGVGYLSSFTDTNPDLLVIGLGAAIVTVALWGAFESLAVAAVFTVVEIAGLLVVVWVGSTGSSSSDWVSADISAIDMSGVALAAVLAFFAFVGFEDMVNMVEEVKNPSRSMPIAIVTSLVIVSALYMAVTVAAVRTVEIPLLAESNQPLALVYETATGANPRFLSAIAVVAALNGVLAQIVMASRVLYGLGRTHPSLATFHQAHQRTGTPVLATCVVGLVAVAGALLLDLEALAETTSTFLLATFSIMNVALIVLKRRGPSPGFSVPMWVPVFGFAGSVAALVASLVW